MNIKYLVQLIVTKLQKKISNSYNYIAKISKETTSQHRYRVISIEKREDDFYEVEIQITNKNCSFKVRPEEILASNEMTDAFSQRDIRMLAYLGYLGIHSPMYHILAKSLSQKDNKLLFSIKKRGTKSTFIKTANEITVDENLIHGLPQKDAHLIGYIAGTEHTLAEINQKKLALKKENN